MILPQPQLPGPSAVNEDVLLAIFDCLQPSDLASTARACKFWNVPSRRVLYSTIVFSDRVYDSELKRSRAQTLNLSRTLTADTQTGEQNRSFIRRLKVVFGDGIPYPKRALDKYYSWISLLKVDTVHTLVIDDCFSKPHPDFIEFINNCPVLQTVRNLTVTSMPFKRIRPTNGVTHPKLSATKFLSLPRLQSLQIGVEYITIPHRSPTALKDIAKFTELKQLALTMGMYSGDIRPLLRRLRNCLIRLDIHFTACTKSWSRWSGDGLVMLCEDLGGFTQLQHLTVTRSFDLRGGSTGAFMDAAFQGQHKLEGLKSLQCSDHLFTETLIDEMPSTIQVLKLERKHLLVPGSPDAAKWDAIVARVIARKKGKDPFALRTLEFVSLVRWEERDADIADCKAVGIDLQVKTVLYQELGVVYERRGTPVSYFTPLYNDYSD